MDKVRNIQQLNERELELGIRVGHGSWHDEYATSAYVYLGGLSADLTEGDVLVIASQFGTVTDVNLIRDKETGASKGFAYVAYADQRSTVLAVDNFTGAELLGRTLRCDHVPLYRVPSSKSANKTKKKKRGVADDSSSSDSGTDSELELYQGATDGLTPLQRRMIRAKVKRDLARQAGAELPPSDDDDAVAAAADDGKNFGHSFYAVEETSDDRRKRRRAEKKAAKAAKREKQHDDDERRRRAAAAAAAPPPPPPQGGLANPFLAAKLREMASSSQSTKR